MLYCFILPLLSSAFCTVHLVCRLVGAAEGMEAVSSIVSQNLPFFLFGKEEIYYPFLEILGSNCLINECNNYIIQHHRIMMECGLFNLINPKSSNETHGPLSLTVNFKRKYN